MADILIKGMELPKGDEPRHILIYSDGKVCTDNGHHDFELSFATAIELPHHGDLKDYDFIGNKMSNTYEKNKDKWNPAFADGFMYALKMLDKAPTILEASNGTDN